MQNTYSRSKTLSYILIYAMIMVLIVCRCPFAFAATFAGSGSKSGPYLVETAAQLNAIRDNLSAHYKLANTIDMSSYGEFTQIGNLASPFTGSFTCDTNADGTPKYAIKNLKVYNHSGEKFGHKIENAASYVDYKENASSWETALFGCTSSATFEHIAVLSVNVTNTVIGQNQMNKDWSINPGQDQQAASILIGIAKGTSITGCVVTGTVNSKSNHTGGMIGYLTDGSSLSYSYSTATVISSGYWHTGGLVGTCESDITGCFATGDVKGGATEDTTGGLVGCIPDGCTATVTSCYSTGTVSPDNNGYSIFGIDKNFNPTWAMNCYTTSAVNGYRESKEYGSPINNNFILSGVIGRQDGFKLASASEIKAAFSSTADWDFSGDLPKLKNVSVINDESKYVTDAVSATAQQAQTASSAATTNNSGTVQNQQSTQTSVDVATFSECINALPPADLITLDNKKELKEIKAIFDSLTPEQLSSLSSETVAKYQSDYKKIVPLVMKDLVKY